MESVSLAEERNRGAPPPGGEHRAAWNNARELPGRSARGAPAERTEDRLAQLAASVGPLRRVLAAIAARLIASRAHERLCYARLGDYARERPGVSARQLQDLARVHHALARLPGLERALLENTLPWSKVRLLARIATPADEDLWIARARDVPTRRLEQDVRGCAGDDAPDALDDAPPEATVGVRCTPAVCEKWSLVRELAERVAGQRLRSGEALELVAAEICSGIPIDRELPSAWGDDPHAPSRDEIRPAERAGACTARARPRELPPAVASLAAGLEDADPFELDRRLRRAVALEQTLDAAIAPLLRAVTSAWHEWSGDYQTLSAYAREQLGMSAGKARALVRLERAGDICPELRAAYRSGRLSWVKAQCLLPLFLLDIEGEWRPAWVAWAARVTVRRLAADVERALLLRAAHHLAWHRCKFDPEKAQDPIPPSERQLCAHDVDPDATQQIEWRVPQEVAWLFRAVLETVRARLRTATAGTPATGGNAATAAPLRWPLDGEVFDALLDGALVAWTLRDPQARRPDPVMVRDGYRCLIPGCSSRRNLHDHHVAFRSAGGSNAPGNRIALCAFHHLRCLHAGFLRVSGQAPHGLVFELGLRAGAAPLACYRSGDVSVDATRIATIPHAHGPTTRAHVVASCHP